MHAISVWTYDKEKFISLSAKKYKMASVQYFKSQLQSEK